MKAVRISSLAETPLGQVWAALSEQGLVAVSVDVGRETFVGELRRMGFEVVEGGSQAVEAALAQIGEYLAGVRREFDLPVDWSVMTSFQQEALLATLAIPYGQVTTYGDLARSLGRPGAARAVGRAEATNPLPLVIPCHRVLGSDGGLHGYGAGRGLETKAWLLELEGARAGSGPGTVERQEALPGF